MRRRNKLIDIIFFIIILCLALKFFEGKTLFYTNNDLDIYSNALEYYKNADYENAYKEFDKIHYNSSLKSAALFRQARCATNLKRNDIAIKKYKKILKQNYKIAITPLSEYNMAILLYDIKEKNNANKTFKNIIKKYPQTDYAIASNYYLGLIAMDNNTNKNNHKNLENAFNYFKTYIENSPDGRYSIRSINKIKDLNIKLNNYDNFLIAKSYYSNGEYEKAKNFFINTEISETWNYIALNEYKLGNKDTANKIVETKIKENSHFINTQDFYKLVDTYIDHSISKANAIKTLKNIGIKDEKRDYIEYLYCKDFVSNDNKSSCYNDFFEKFPNGQFSAEALFNVFMNKYLTKRYYEAQRLGTLHLKKYPKVNSTPAVLYFMGKIYSKQKRIEAANNYYHQLLKIYPDSYYSYRAFINLNKSIGNMPFYDIEKKPIIFPYKKSLEDNLILKLALLQDYDLVEELSKNDLFIQSWLAYKKDNYTISVILARNAFDKMNEKPDFKDLRWRLAYPIHYYDIVEKMKNEVNPLIIEAIIKEESHFNSQAKSIVGAFGLMQLMPKTYNEVIKKFKISEKLSSDIKNITAGSLYYANLKYLLENNDIYAISAYNGGIGNVNNWLSNKEFNDVDDYIETIPYPETKNYVKKVLRTYWMYGNIYKNE